MITTASPVHVRIHLDGTWEVAYPCRCGIAHGGAYGAEDYAMHACLHDAPLTRLATDQVACGLCGQSWQVIAPPTPPVRPLEGFCE